jgi:hypothetical protein
MNQKPNICHYSEITKLWRKMAINSSAITIDLIEDPDATGLDRLDQNIFMNSALGIIRFSKPA